MVTSYIVNPCEKLFDHQYILYDADAVPKLEVISFDPQELAERHALIGEVLGRGPTYFIRIEGNDWVLRHYHRGGIVGRFLKDSYLWTGIHRTRAWREWRMLGKLWEWGLPVPRPIVARVLRRGPFYKADIITQRLTNTRSLTELIRERSLNKQKWKAIGICIRRFHGAGVYHPDITADNILLTQEKDVYLIDFDNCELRDQCQGWRLKNLARLRRSLIKRRSLYDSFYFSDGDWQVLCEGYGDMG
ncbi:MAG: 3-deoxy-D-manno-octulosonic acid kinase [Acidiferrobacterales bacterium]